MTTSHENPESSKKILLVEDDPMVQLATIKALSKYGHQVEVADNGMDALKMVMATKSKTGYDLVLMDLDMPILDGFETSVELKKYGFLNPIVSFSSKAHLKRLEHRRLIDFSISKPIVIEEFINTLGAIQRLNADEVSIAT